VNVVIVGSDQDIHVSAVKWGLKEMGTNVVTWPSIGVSESSLSIDISKKEMLIANNKISTLDTVWFRRLFNDPQIHPELHSDDIRFVTQESKLLFKSALSWLNRTVKFCANDYHTHNQVENKSYQLMLASESNLMVPSTIITNQPKEALQFIEKNGSVIHKTAYPYKWENNSASSRAIASLITKESIQDEFSITSCPSILQQYIKKSADIRVFVLGSYICAVKISSRLGDEVVDWRPLSLGGSLDYSLIEMPPIVTTALFEFMKRTGLVMGVFDFSVDHNDLWWFLEVNTQGQWLFMEDWIPGLNLLGKFCSFLIEQNPNYDGRVIDQHINIQNYEKEILSKDKIVANQP